MPAPKISEDLPLDYGHTCMNRFAVLDLRQVRSPTSARLAELAKTLCANPFADDLLIIEPSANANADARMRIIGGDGREADFCANGLVYVSGKLGQESGREQVSVETPAGIRAASHRGVEWDAEVGEASLLDAERQRLMAGALANRPVLGLIRAGEPHLVLGIPPELPGFHVTRSLFEDYCRPLRDITGIAGGVNVTMVFQQTEDSVLIRTFERGVKRHTFSCGTGAVSAIVAVFGIPTQDRTFNVCSPGGMHSIRYEDGRWHIAARPQRLARGYLSDDTIHLPLASLMDYRDA